MLKIKELIRINNINDWLKFYFPLEVHRSIKLIRLSERKIKQYGKSNASSGYNESLSAINDLR